LSAQTTGENGAKSRQEGIDDRNRVTTFVPRRTAIELSLLLFVKQTPQT
jgi:hypothetical protein